MVLENGLVALIKDNYKGLNVAVSILIRAGQDTEELDYVGIRQFLSRLVLASPVTSETHNNPVEPVKSNEKDLIQPFITLEEGIENLGGVIDATTTSDYVEFTMVIPKKFFKTGLTLLTKKLFAPDFSNNIVEQTRRELLQRQEEVRREAYGSLYDIFLKQFYTYHPYRLSMYGNKNSIERVNADVLKKFHFTTIMPVNMIVSVVGPVEQDNGVAIVNDIFAKYPAGKRVPSPIFYEPKMEESETLYYHGDNEVSWIFLGYSAPPVKSQDYEAMQVINQILGTGLSSRIWMELREKRGLAYHLGSNFPARQNASHFIVYAATNRGSLEESKKIIMKEISKIKNVPLTDDELATMKRMIIGRFLIDIESSRAKASFMAWSEAFGKGILYERSYMERILALTSKKIQEVARRHLGKYILIMAE